MRTISWWFYWWFVLFPKGISFVFLECCFCQIFSGCYHSFLFLSFQGHQPLRGLLQYSYSTFFLFQFQGLYIYCSFLIIWGYIYSLLLEGTVISIFLQIPFVVCFITIIIIFVTNNIVISAFFTQIFSLFYHHYFLYSLIFRHPLKIQ